MHVYGFTVDYTDCYNCSVLRGLVCVMCAPPISLLLSALRWLGEVRALAVRFFLRLGAGRGRGAVVVNLCVWLVFGGIASSPLVLCVYTLFRGCKKKAIKKKIYINVDHRLVGYCSRFSFSSRSRHRIKRSLTAPYAIRDHIYTYNK